MLIYNTTYHASAAVYDDFVKWLRSEYIPHVSAGGVLRLPQLARVMDGSDDAEGRCYALQFRVESVEVLNQWINSDGRRLAAEIVRRFGRDVAGFATLMEEIDTD